MITKDMIDFLITAKRKTYAGGSAAGISSRPNSHDLTYLEGDYEYIDTYLGGEIFCGEEAVWQKGIPIWSMNYSGRVVGEGFSGDFLKEALYLASEKYPYRGPLVYHNGDNSYHCIINGDIEWFQGQEEIFAGSRKVYECFFHGSCIKQ